MTHCIKMLHNDPSHCFPQLALPALLRSRRALEWTAAKQIMTGELRLEVPNLCSYVSNHAYLPGRRDRGALLGEASLPRCVRVVSPNRARPRSNDVAVLLQVGPRHPRTGAMRSPCRAARLMRALGHCHGIAGQARAPWGAPEVPCHGRGMALA